ncbi:iron-containing alcohol dehydrogenase [Sporanaerobacter sp. PP17-6a]|uniref:iron-containing alcohol dehydrogenase n=1 Tax=Sporanaerobacter sp. PP17-6a TaxID=1891289 RepID=UPI0008A082C4|nr:iron-containing alcohol dehydrogenase [Sporanaerobacter sp. PP17-6a]SCL90399.1 1,3-propanediol dehydrogenase [Sporanaerobacter sp. PP17-6a]
MADLFMMPEYIYTGDDALNLAEKKISELGKKALIVTGSTVIKFGSIKKLTNLLDKIGIKYETYSEINGEPTDIMVDKGIKKYKENGCDFIIGFGGGSSLDTAKAVGAMITNEGEINDYLGKIIPNPIPPLVAIPTTAGTGSEVTQFTIISDTKRDIKMLLKGHYLIPKLAVIDPFFTLSAPPKVTSSTGLDALTHAIEAYTSKKAQPLSDIFAVSAVKRIFKNLLKTYNNGKDTDARREMSIAALEAGIAFNNSSVTIVHGMSRPIGALFHIPHGLSNAMLLNNCLEFALKGAVERFCDLAKAIGTYKEGMTELEGGQSFINSVGKLCSDLNIQTLEEFGVDRNEYFGSLDKMAEDALQSGSPQNTRRNPQKEDIVKIYRSLWK